MLTPHIDDKNRKKILAAQGKKDKAPTKREQLAADTESKTVSVDALQKAYDVLVEEKAGEVVLKEALEAVDAAKASLKEVNPGFFAKHFGTQ